MLWSRKVNRHRFRKLVLTWDTNVMKMNNAKLEDSKLPSSAAKSTPTEISSSSKLHSKAEMNINKQRRTIDNESNYLGLNKKESAKKAGDIKTQFEVILDHMYERFIQSNFLSFIRKLRGAMLSLTENEEAQKHQPTQQGASLSAIKNTEGRHSAVFRMDTVPKIEQIIRETLLPYTIHGFLLKRKILIYYR